MNSWLTTFFSKNLMVPVQLYWKLADKLFSSLQDWFNSVKTGKSVDTKRILPIFFTTARVHSNIYLGFVYHSYSIWFLINCHNIPNRKVYSLIQWLGYGFFYTNLACIDLYSLSAKVTWSDFLRKHFHRNQNISWESGRTLEWHLSCSLQGSAHSRPTYCRISKFSAPLQTIKQDLNISTSLQLVKLVNSGNELSGLNFCHICSVWVQLVPSLVIPEILSSSSLKLAQLI